MVTDIELEAVLFASMLPEPVGSGLDAHFKKNGWELQSWDTGKAQGYQVFFGTGVQVDNLFEYGFPYLYDKDELIAFARDFYSSRVCNDSVCVQQPPLDSQIQFATTRGAETHSSEKPLVKDSTPER